jgi:ubiquinone/menaquinone biosynthesis C-methylase UbiE
MKRPEYEWMYRSEDSHWWFVSRRRLVNALLEPLLSASSNERILDIGCGTGGNLERLARWGNTVGLDLNPVALNLARCRKLPRLTQASGPALPYSNDTFTLVTAFDVLYHRWIPDNNQALDECYRVLKSGGWLLLTNPALPALWSTHDEIFYTRQRYTLSNARQKLIESGFKPCLCSYANALLLPIIFVVRLAARWFKAMDQASRQPPPAWLNHWLIGIGNLEGAWVRRGGTFPLGSSLICLAQKSPENHDKNVRATFVAGHTI